ncbi:hypothetical protein Sjap_003467 [Stephania japonica]|uniref:Receptor-like serine/threonine-protein kinase n=1 Tax=Stephania japonica TaxID=461633 RepID=A0AAP0KQW8_9MAGN
MEPLLTTLSVFLCFFMSISSSSSTTDTLLANQSLTDGQTLTSSDHTFELGFFSPGKSKNRYLGIWFKNSNSTVVWVANRANPISGSSGALTFQSGNLILLNGSKSKTPVWSSNLTSKLQNPAAQLLWSGNFVIKDGISGGLIVWKSFDYPVDTLLVGVNITRHKDLVSWKSTNDPSPGQYSFSIEAHGMTQLVLRNASAKWFRTGPWNGLEFPGLDYFLFNPSFAPSFRSGTEGGESVYRRIVLSPTGWLQRLTWNNQSSEWDVLNSVPQQDCDKYGFCGANGVCYAGKTPVCECLAGFVPKNWQEWGRMDWRGGCVRRTELENGGRDGFLAIQKLKMPDVLDYWTSSNMSLDGCRKECLRNGSCVAYAISDISEGGKGCIMWFGDLMDIRLFDNDGLQQLYLKLASSDIEAHSRSSKKNTPVVAIVVPSVGVLMAILGIIGWYIIRSARKKTEGDGNAEDDDLDLPLYDWTTIATATSNFSFMNKIGEGGFGPVYRGKLVDGQEIAVKRLSMDSGQGITEFKNEVSLISKLQHRNLVRLLGCCIHGHEKLLIYEYMPNESLDYFIYGLSLSTVFNDHKASDLVVGTWKHGLLTLRLQGLREEHSNMQPQDKERSNLLDWQKRFDIIMGVARGLLYLHQDSRLRIIHRDLKTSNILLDEELNPKISDFGMARIFAGDQMEANTKRVVGTYGYMSPEYALEGFFSTKSDIFSFGVVVLEIVSGRKNRGFGNSDEEHNLLGNAWTLWQEGKAMEIMDIAFEESCIPSEVLKCIQVGLLCVQQLSKDRPSMSSVVSMLSSETVSLPQPILPGYFTEINIDIVREESHSENGVTVTLLGGR